MVSKDRVTAELVQPYFRGYVAEFDGLRAVGLSLVLIDHFWLQGLSYLVFQLGNLGWIAMDSFFVMSGFLITGILLDSRDKPNYLGTYYKRRSLRIFPLYYAVLLTWYLILRYANFGNDLRAMEQNWGSPAWFMFYLGNLRQVFAAIPPSKLPSVANWAYAPLWSLQIEEQFYLLFPLAVAWLKREHLSRLLIATVVLSPAIRCLLYLWHPGNPYLQYTELPCHCEGLALGALIAIRLRSSPWKISKLWLTLSTALLLGAACAGSLLSTWGTRNQAWSSLWDRLAGYSISSAGCACLILWLICFRGSVYTAWLRTPPLRYLGKICYGVYLLHPLAMWTVQELAHKNLIHFRKDDPLYVAMGIGLSLIYASLSWQLFERPILAMKDRITNFRTKLITVAVAQ